MSCAHNCRDLENSIRKALSAEAFAEAEALFDLYAEAVSNELSASSLDSSLLIAAQADEFFGWARAMIVSARDGAAAEFARLQSTSVYCRRSIGVNAGPKLRNTTSSH